MKFSARVRRSVKLSADNKEVKRFPFEFSYIYEIRIFIFSYCSFSFSFARFNSFLTSLSSFCFCFALPVNSSRPALKSSYCCDSSDKYPSRPPLCPSRSMIRSCVSANSDSDCAFPSCTASICSCVDAACTDTLPPVISTDTAAAVAINLNLFMI